MTSIYTQDAADALADIRAAGATVTFPGAIVGTAPTYDPAMDTYSGGTTPSDATGSGIQLPDNPAKYQALKLVLTNPIMLLVAASGLAITPAPLGLMTWASVTYTIQHVEAFAPDGTAILYTLIGSA